MESLLGGLKKSLQSGVVAMNRPTKTPTTGGGRACFARSANFSVLLIVLEPLLSGISTDLPKLQKYGLHPIKNRETKAVLWAT